ncbi:MAG: hypothetical protein QM734_00150 [Cyclobacteriaceae bacterium]
MKTSKIKHALLFCIVISIYVGCSKSSSPAPNANIGLVGNPGNPRFNLHFDNETNVDLDLHVIDPSGAEIFWESTTSASGGHLDVDCLCGDCPQGPTENIYWAINGNSPSGTYKYWVEYYSYCDSPASSNFTLKVLTGNNLVATHTGSLSSGSSTMWTINK